MGLFLIGGQSLIVLLGVKVSWVDPGWPGLTDSILTVTRSVWSSAPLKMTLRAPVKVVLK